ncbi:MAG: FKBP-type peptidyl-prolyl cis-trans isomerase [Candidatus Hydrogenedentales bacterium]|jgi:FKBP-type peptidyl-prolyl cis-trans isomerase
MKSVHLLVALTALTFLFPAVLTTAAFAEESKAVLDTETAKESYLVGLQLGDSIKSLNIEIDTAALSAAIEDVIAERTPALSEEELLATMQSLQGKMQKQQERMQEEMQTQSAENLKKAEAFLETNAKEANVVKTDSGLQYIVVKEGTGETPPASATVRVHYAGTLLDGTEFDSSYKRGAPAEFPVKGVIEGWQEALQLMKVGAQYKLFVPPDLAYGAQPRPGIPGNSLLVFEVELLEILPEQQSLNQSTIIQ